MACELRLATRTPTTPTLLGSTPGRKQAAPRARNADHSVLTPRSATPGPCVAAHDLSGPTTRTYAVLAIVSGCGSVGQAAPASLDSPTPDLRRTCRETVRRGRGRNQREHILFATQVGRSDAQGIDDGTAIAYPHGAAIKRGQQPLVRVEVERVCEFHAVQEAAVLSAHGCSAGIPSRQHKPYTKCQRCPGSDTANEAPAHTYAASTCSQSPS